MLLLSLVPACGGREQPERFSAELRPMNDSGVTGSARVERTGGHLRVVISARGLAPEQIHEQRLGGFAGTGREARCPAGADDADGDGRLSPSEARRAYGGEVMSLEPFPTVGRERRLRYDLTFPVAPERAEAVDRRVIVLHGMSTRGYGGRGYRAEVPVACGALAPERG